MNEKQTPDNPGGRAALIVIGGVLILFGLSTLGDVAGFSVIFQPFGTAFTMARRWMLPLAALAGGVLIIVFASKGGFEFRVPNKSDRLYRSETDKMISGVIGGIASYLGMDSTVLRLAVVAVALLTDAWPIIVAYLVASVVVPVGPKDPASGQPQ